MSIVNGRLIGITLVMIVVSVMLDTSIPDISTYTGGLDSSVYYLIIFISVTIVYAITQFIILNYVKSKIEVVTTNNIILNLHRFVSILQFIILGLILVLIFQMLLFGIYASILLKVIVSINYVVALILFAFLGVKLLMWERLNRNVTLISYSVAVFGLSLTCMLSIFYLPSQLVNQLGMNVIFPMKTVQIFVGDANNNFSLLYNVTFVTSFIITWVATVFLLHHYSKRIGRPLYWIMVFIPLIYFLTQFQSYIPDIFQGFHESDPLLYAIAYTLFYNTSKPIAGILFGLAFWSVSRAIKNSIVRDYMLISAFGMVMFFTANQPSALTLVPYPPFGVVTISFVALSSYLILIGIYTSSISISTDTELLKLVRKSLPYDSNLLGSIGGANEIQQIQNRTLKITSQLANKIDKETGIQTSIEEEDIKEYLNEILQVLRGKK